MMQSKSTYSMRRTTVPINLKNLYNGKETLKKKKTKKGTGTMFEIPDASEEDSHLQSSSEAPFTKSSSRGSDWPSDGRWRREARA